MDESRTVIIEIDPIDPEPWLVARAADVLRKGGVAIIPTDTVYGLACGISHDKAIKRIYALKDMDPKKPLALLVRDMTTVGVYARGVTTPFFRLLKRVLPGPYTFIFEATAEVPKIMLASAAPSEYGCRTTRSPWPSSRSSTNLC